MLIKEFCQRTGLPRDTVRFYVKRGLLTPDVGTRQSNRYQVFDTYQIERAKMIRAAQRLGFTLGQIAELGKSYHAEAAGSEARKAVLREQIEQLAARERELRHVRTYLSAKLHWVESGEVGPPPTMGGSAPDPKHGRGGRVKQARPGAISK
jgi:DNA-binding transcriptional MerR regulator